MSGLFAAGRVWGATKESKRTELRGIVGLDERVIGSPPARRADVVLYGVDGRFSYELAFPGGRSARSLYVFASLEAARAEAEAVALSTLALLNAPTVTP